MPPGVPLTADLINYVAHCADDFKIGGLSLVQNGTYDLNFTIKVLHPWLDADTIVELVTLAGSCGLGQAEQLQPRLGGRVPNPGGDNHNGLFAGPERQGREDVWDVHNRSLDTQSCKVLGTAERIALAPDQVLVDGWFVLGDHGLWTAGRRESNGETVVWRVPCAEVTTTKRLELHGLPTFVVYFGRDHKLCVGTRTDDAVATLERHYR